MLTAVQKCPQSVFPDTDPPRENLDFRDGAPMGKGAVQWVVPVT